MTPLPRFLSENFFNDLMFDGHLLSASDEAAGSQVWRVGTGRRLSVRNKWTPTTFNAQHWIAVDCGSAKEADMVVLDRGHNLSGHTVQVQSDDNSGFSSPTDHFNGTIPSTVTVDDDLSATPGVLTEEGAWMFTFTPATDQYWRILIPAMGANLKPTIVGAYLGKSWEPAYLMDLPVLDESGEAFFEEVQSDTAWSASSRVANRREGRITLKLRDQADYTAGKDTIRLHFMEKNRLMWIVFNQEQAERSVLAKHRRGRYEGFTYRDGWGYRQTAFDWVEYEPKID